MLQRPPIPVVGVALITEFIVEVVLIILIMMIIGRIHTQGLCIKSDYWGLGAGGMEESLAEGP